MRAMLNSLLATLAVALLASSWQLALADDAKVTVDTSIPGYKVMGGVSGNVKSVGSDTLNNLMTLWGEGFKKHYPNITMEIEGKGTGTAMPALVAGSATFGPMSRQPKSDETASFEKAFGYKPTAIPVALDLLAVFVNKNNPVKGLTLPQVDAMFSSTRKLEFSGDITTWGDVGMAAPWADRPISLYGRNAASGTYGYFKDVALGKGDFKDTVKVQPGSSGVVQAIGAEENAIGYSGIGFANADVRAVPLAAKEGASFVAAEPANAYNGTYPMWRALYVTVNKNPVKELPPLQREFLKYILSQEGQQIVVQDGYLPLPAKAVKKALEMVDIK